jgi:hypothetical protein
LWYYYINLEISDCGIIFLVEKNQFYYDRSMLRYEWSSKEKKDNILMLISGYDGYYDVNYAVIFYGLIYLNNLAHEAILQP